MTVPLTKSLTLSLLFLSCTSGQLDMANMEPHPPPSGPYVDDPLSSHSYNLMDYEQLTSTTIETFQESPLLAERVNAGALPPVLERLPGNPLVMVPWETIGQYGGTMRYVEFTIDYDHYLRHFNEVYLLEQRPEPGVAIYKWVDGTIQPGVFESWSQNTDATVFTFRIREGLKWSDGEPVTTEDVRYTIEDVILNRSITPIPV